MSRLYKTPRYKINVSQIKQFSKCPYRWWAQYVINRVPLVTPAALDGGKIYHRAHERHEAGRATGMSLREALAAECADFRAKIPTEPEVCHAMLEKAVVTFEDVIEAMDLHEDKFLIQKVLEVEVAHEWDDPVLQSVTWLGRPDKGIVSGSRLWHVQRRGLAASKNFATYVRLQKRSYHEHLYAEMFHAKYPQFKVGGTVFDLLRKLKYRTNVGRSNEKVKTADEMFYQQIMTVNLKSDLHIDVMNTMRRYAAEMIEVRRAWEEDLVIPLPNDEENGGYSGSSEDPYFKVLIGETTLDDDTLFKDRQDQYAERTEEA